MGRGDLKKPTICQLCGKSDDRVVGMFVGGYVNWAHGECAEIGERVIRLWREHQEFLNKLPMRRVEKNSLRKAEQDAANLKRLSAKVLRRVRGEEHE